MEKAAIENIEKIGKLYKPAFLAIKKNRILLDCRFNKQVRKLLEKAAEKF
ncbi:MAG: hypothetical protein JRJ49_04660 [Deltaproteobacteria bacterium]|nr:hypothetical protein [Deltaproteobacteria bacterium]